MKTMNLKIIIILLLAVLCLNETAWSHDAASHGIHFKHSVPTEKNLGPK